MTMGSFLLCAGNSRSQEYIRFQETNNYWGSIISTMAIGIELRALADASQFVLVRNWKW